MYWLKGDGNKDSETLTPFTVSDEIVEYPGSLMDTIQAKPIKEFLKTAGRIIGKSSDLGLRGSNRCWDVHWLYRYQPAAKTTAQTGQITTDTAGIDTHHPYHQYRDSAHYYIVRRQLNGRWNRS